MSYIPITPVTEPPASSSTSTTADTGESDTATLSLREQEEARSLLEQILIALLDIKEQLVANGT